MYYYYCTFLFLAVGGGREEGRHSGLSLYQVVRNFASNHHAYDNSALFEEIKLQLQLKSGRVKGVGGGGGGGIRIGGSITFREHAVVHACLIDY